LFLTFYFILELCRDHTANDEIEAARIVALGGEIVWGVGTSGERGMARVNGELAVTRSLGDIQMKPLLIADPHVTILDLSQDSILSPMSQYMQKFDKLNEERIHIHFDFLVVATDGLWDVMSNDEVIAYVKARRTVGGQNPSKASWQEVSASLTHEALLRGSLDNIGVCVVDLRRRLFRA